MEAKTKTEIVKEAIEWSASCGRGGDLKDVIVFLTEQVDARIQTIDEIKESNEGQAELIRKLQEENEKQTDRAERAEKEIRELKTIGAIEHDDWKTLSREDQTIVTINRKPDEILSVSVLFTDPNEEGGEDDE